MRYDCPKAGKGKGALQPTYICSDASAATCSICGSEGHLKHKCPNILDPRLAHVSFQPGRLGLGENSGKVFHVEANGQADLQGVKVGWRLLTVDGLTFTRERLREKTWGGNPYNVTFQTNPNHNHNNHHHEYDNQDDEHDKIFTSSSPDDDVPRLEIYGGL